MPNQWTGRTPVLDRLQSKISTTPTPTGCLEWQGSRTAKGYGRFNRGDYEPETTAHRAVWEEAHGPLAPGQVVCHTCDNPPCCRLDHLFAGTYADNERDKISKDRRGDLRNFGSANGRYKHGRYAMKSDPNDVGIVKARP